MCKEIAIMFLININNNWAHFGNDSSHKTLANTMPQFHAGAIFLQLPLPLLLPFAQSLKPLLCYCVVRPPHMPP